MKRKAVEDVNNNADTNKKDTTWFIQKAKSLLLAAALKCHAICKESREQATAFYFGNFQFPCFFSASILCPFCSPLYLQQIQG